MKSTQKPWELYGLTAEYWNRITSADHELYALVRPLRTATYAADHALNMLERALDSYQRSAERDGGVFELNPDFQRGNVWDEARQVAYVENLLRGTAPYILKFNCAGWDSLGEVAGDLHPHSIVCVDGLQRMTAVRRFIAGEIRPFGRSYDQLTGTAFNPGSFRVRVEMFDIKNRAELLQFYLDLNTGGVVHTPEELDRVKALMEVARAKSLEQTVSTLASAEGVSMPTPVATSATSKGAAAKKPKKKIGT